MRTAAVNLKAGGLSAKIDALLERVLSHRAHIHVFSEFRDTAAGAHIRSVLRRAGHAHQAYSAGHRGNGVLVTSSEPFDTVYNPAGLPEDAHPHAMIECIFAEMHVIGCYLPGQDRKRPHLSFLSAFARAMNERKLCVMAVGDFNSGRNETDIEANLGKTRLVDEFSTADLYRQLEEHWTEAWLYRNPGARQFSWYPRMGPPLRKNGWRLDKAFLSPALLERLENAFYDHEFRLQALTDHSALVVDLAL